MMNQNPVGIGAYVTPVDGCGCGARPRSLGSNGALSEASWALGIGAIVLLGIAAVVVSRSFKEAGF